MHKTELIEGLRRFIRSEDCSWRGQSAFAHFLIYYLENLKIPHDEKYDFWSIEHYLPQIAVDAFEALRTGTDERIVCFRKMYEGDTGHEVPNITDLGASNLLDQGSAIQTALGFMLSKVTQNQWLKSQIDAYCNAQKYVLQQTFDKFLRLVWREGLFEIVDKCRARGMSGVFGETELRTFVMAGRVMFTFVRRKEGKTTVRVDGEIIHELPYQEDSISFVAEDNDPLALSAGIQSVCADFRTSLDMIEDVIKNYPATQKERKRIFAANKDVSILF